MKTVSFIALLLSVTLFTISAYTNSPFFGAIAIFGMVVSLGTFIDAFYFQKKSKKVW